MTDTDIKDIVYATIRGHLALDDDYPIRDDHKLNDDLGADSLDVVEIAMSIEDRCDIIIPDSEVGQARTVGDLVKCAADNVARTIKQLGKS